MSFLLMTVPPCCIIEYKNIENEDRSMLGLLMAASQCNKSLPLCVRRCLAFHASQFITQCDDITVIAALNQLRPQ